MRASMSQPKHAQAALKLSKQLLAACCGLQCHLRLERRWPIVYCRAG